MSEETEKQNHDNLVNTYGWGWIEKSTMLKQDGFRSAPPGYQPEPDIHDIEMVGSELWIKDKEEK